MKWIKGKVKAGVVLGSFFIAAGFTSVDVTHAQEVPEGEIIVVSCGLGRRPEGSVSRSQDINVKQTDIIQQVGDTLILLRKDVLYSIALNSDTDAPAEVLSSLKVESFGSADYLDHNRILVTDDLVILFTDYDSKENGYGEGVSFYSFLNGGELEFQDRYFFDESNLDFYSLLSSMTLVDNTLVSVIEGGLDEEGILEEISENKKISLNAQRQSASEKERHSFDILKNEQWSNSFSSLNQGNEFTGVLTCPLDDVLESGLQCDVSFLLGASSYSYYISPSAVYIASTFYSGSNFGVMVHDTDAFLKRTDHEVNPDFIEEKSAFYRIDLDYNDVTAVLFDGWPLSSFTYEEVGDSFIALLNRPNELGVTDHAVYGLQFSLDQFSALPTLLPESDYQFLSLSDGRVLANRFTENQLVLAKSNGRYNERRQDELIVWDVDSEEVYSFESDFHIDDLYYQGDNLLIIGKDESGAMLQVWSLGDEIESLFFEHYEQYALGTRAYGLPFLDMNEKQSIWGLPVYQLDKDGEVAEYIDTEGDEQPLLDIAYFQSSDDGQIIDLGKLTAESHDVADDCERSCDSWYRVARSFVVDDKVYALTVDDIIKGGITENGFQEYSRLTILPFDGEEITEE